MDFPKVYILFRALKKAASKVFNKWKSFAKRQDKAAHVVERLHIWRRLFVELFYFAVLIFGVLLLYFRVSEEKLVVEPIIMPPGLSERGITGEALARDFRHRIFHIYENSTIRSGNMEVVGEWQDNLAGVEVAAVGLSLERIIREIKSFVGNPNTMLGGEVLQSGDQLTVIVRNNYREIYRSTFSQSAFSEAALHMAEAAVKNIDPHILAMYYYQREGPSERTLQQMEYSKNNGSDMQRSYAYVLNCFIESDAKNYEKAKPLCQSAIKADPNSFYAYNALAIVFFRLKQYDMAIENCLRALEINPEYPQLYYNVGLSLRRLKRLQESVSYFEKAIQVKPDYADAYYSQAISLTYMNKRQEAVEKYEKAIHYKPETPYFYNGHSYNLSKIGRHEEAIEAIQRAVELRDNYDNAYDTWAFVLNNMGRYGEAIEKAKIALEINPEQSFAWENWGRSLYEMGSYKEARLKFDNALKTGPEEATHYYFSAQNEEALGETQEALKKYERFLELSNYQTESDYIRKARKNIAQLTSLLP